MIIFWKVDKDHFLLYFWVNTRQTPRREQNLCLWAQEKKQTVFSMEMKKKKLTAWVNLKELRAFDAHLKVQRNDTSHVETVSLISICHFPSDLDNEILCKF